jgi:hypothetical protein
VDAAAGHYVWDTSALPAGERYLLRLDVTDGPSVTRARTPGAIHLLGENRPPRGEFWSPDGEGLLTAGRRVVWTATDPDGDALRSFLDVSEDGGATWREVARCTGRTSQHDLRDLVCGEGYLLRLRVTDGFYTTHLLSPLLDLGDLDSMCADLVLEAPLGGENWSGVREVQWSAAHPVSFELGVDLHISGDGGKTWDVVTEGFPNTGVYDLDTRAWPNGDYCIR